MEPIDSSEPLVVVGVDGSAPSIAALRFAREYAEKIGAHLRAVFSWSYPLPYNPLPSSWSPEEDAQLQLWEASRKVFGTDMPPRYEQSVREGFAAKNLLDESRAAAVLVVGSRGYGGFSGLLLGSVSSACAAHAQCAVIVIHDDDDSTTRVGKNGNTPLLDPVKGRPIVVGYDGSVNGYDAAVWALNAAESLGAPVEIIRTWSIDRIPPQFTVEYGYVPSFEETTARVNRDLVADTRSLLLEHPNVPVTCRAALSQPAKELIRASEHALLLVVGTRGHGGFAGLLLGSVSAECVAHAHIPTVVVPVRRPADTA